MLALNDTNDHCWHLKGLQFCVWHFKIKRWRKLTAHLYCLFFILLRHSLWRPASGLFKRSKKDLFGTNCITMMWTCQCNCGYQLIFHVVEKQITLPSAGTLWEAQSLECCNHSTNDAQSFDQQNKGFIGIIVILLYLQAAQNLSSHGIAFFISQHTKTYAHLS